jgi:hypothetical protein
MKSEEITEVVGALIVGSLSSFFGLIFGAVIGGNTKLFAEVGGYEMTGLLGMLIGMSIGASLFIYFIRKYRKQTAYGKRIALGAIGGFVYPIILFKVFTEVLHFYNVAFILVAVTYVSVIITSWSD